MDLGIKNKLALVTGAGRGIGRAIAKSLAEEGASVIAVSRTKSDLESLINEMESRDNTHVSLSLDLMKEEESKKLIEYILNSSPVDIIVHNLGGPLDIREPFCSLKDWRDVYRLNFEVAIELNLALLPAMRKNKWGRVVHISSVSALENQGAVTYCAMKAALTAYTRSLAGIVAKDNVILSAILPGAVNTDDGYWEDVKKDNPEHYNKFINERMRIGRLGTPEEIANIVAYFCSDLASFSVGSVVPIDGGQGRSFFGL